MFEILFEIGDFCISLQNLDVVKYKTFLNLAWLKCDLGPNTPEYITVKEKGKIILRIKHLFKLGGDVFIGRKV